jgi:hypothetical protein
MVDEGRKIYRQRNATDAETGRTISTPELTQGWTGLTTRPRGLALVAAVGAVIVIVIVAVARGWVAG